jgi:hypothetical protein
MAKKCSVRRTRRTILGTATSSVVHMQKAAVKAATAAATAAAEAAVEAAHGVAGPPTHQGRRHCACQ